MPTVDLNLGPQLQQQAPVNPLGIMEGFAQLQNTLNQNKLFQQTFAARQRLGQIMAAAPDTETGFATAMKDPVAGPFAGEAISAYRQGMLADAQLQGVQQEQAQGGMKGVLGGLTIGLTDPSQVPAAVSSQLKLLSPVARARVEPAINSLVTSLTSGLPKDPDAAKAAFQQRLVALNVASPESVQSILGRPETRNLGGSIQSGVTAPAQGLPGVAPGAFVPGNGLSMGAAPSVQLSPGGAPFALPGIPGGAPASGTNGMGEIPVIPGGIPPTAAAAPAATPQPSKDLAGDGKPLLADTRPTTPASSANQGIMLNPAQAKLNEGLVDSLAKEGPNNMQRAMLGIAQTDEVGADLDKLHSAGGLQEPGALGDFRNGLAKMVNTFEAATGSKLDFDPASVASYEQLNKDTRRMGLSLLTSTLGNQREAAQTITGITQAVPSVDNTYLGAKLVNASIKAQFQWAKDEVTYAAEVANNNNGDIRSAFTDFAKEHPAQGYADAVLQQFGLVKTKAGVGFPDVAGVKNAIKSGLISPEEARAIAKQQFDYTPKPVGQ